MKITKQCPHCERTFVGFGDKGVTMGRVNANITNHIKGAHPEHYQPSKWVLERQAKLAVKPQILISGPDPKPEPVKRPYVRKSQPSSTVCYCPQCGCNIRAVQVAMGI